MAADIRVLHPKPLDHGDDDGPVQIPPHDLDAEAAVISCAFVDDTCVGRVSHFLRPECFYSNAHRRIWEAVLAVHADQRFEPTEGDVVRTGAWLKNAGRIGEVGGMAYLTTIQNSAPTTRNVVPYAVTVHEHWRTRNVIALAQRVAATGYIGVEDAQGFCDRATKAFARIGEQNPLRPVETNDAALRRILAEVAPTNTVDEPKGPAWGYPTGIHSLDKVVCGLMPAHKTTVAATTGVGKTALALQIALKLAKDGVGVLFFSTELKRVELMRRALAHESNVPGERIKRRELSKQEFDDVAMAADRIRRLPLRIDETASITIEQIRAATVAHAERARLIDRVPLGLVVVDYVQRLTVRPELERLEKREKVEHSTKGFKQMCQDLNIAGLELAQGKKGENRKRPSKETGVADSSQVAKEADELIFLCQEERHDTHQDVTLFVAKQRDGVEGVEVDLQYFGEVYRFEDPKDPMRPASREFVDLMGEPQQ